MRNSILVVVLVAVTGCTAFQPRPKPAVTPAAEQTVSGTIRTKHEIDAAALIAELSESGCELVSMTYEEGKRKATFVAKCRTVELPE